jgi:hypothetical protein
MGDMKASKMLDVVMEYHYNVERSDLRSNVIFGCECGCGGDSYDAESWKEMCEDYDKALADFNALCNTLGIENDLEIEK